ncbi:MAG TPA: VIT domain-containing protein [Candidatus Saccharimonadales bacterium]|nr:VIT domain-containing protein [Candidatus Saccharimonadales bacterium]
MKRWLSMLLLLVAGVAPGFSAGIIIIQDEQYWMPHPNPRLPGPGPIRPPRPIPHPVWAPLEVDHVRTTIHVKDQVAVTKVEEEFYNPNSRSIEGTFLFPVPKGAQINKFAMQINGRQVEAELMASDKARGIYEDIVRKLKDPALLEYSGRDLFKVRIFPIEANAKKRITLSYSQILKADNGLVNLVFPLDTEKFSAKPLRNVSVKVDLESKRPLKAIYSPSHRVDVKRDGPNKATIGYESSELKPDADFQLFYTTENSDLGVSLLSYKAAGDDGYFVLLGSPGIETKNNKVMPKDVAFVLDTSGSMAGPKLEQAKKALLFCVENLNEQDRFEIMRFSTEVEPLFNKLVEAQSSAREKARNFIKDLKPMGGTAIDDALKKALAIRPEKQDRPYVLIFLTDGRPTVGNTDENQILDSVKKENKSNTRIFCFGIGTDVNTHLLDQIADETKAFSQYVLPEEDIEVKVSNFYTKIKEPVLANPQITFPRSVRVTSVYPSPLPDLFKGEQIVISGRYSGEGDGAIQIEGMVAGEKKKYAYDVKFPALANDHDFIPRLWATRRVGYLLDEIRLHGENKELKDEVTDLARKYNILTPYTAYLILEDESARGLPTALRTVPQEQQVYSMNELGDQYRRFRNDKDGAAAVSGARSSYSLKSANAPIDAIQSGREEAERGRVAGPPPVTTAPLSSASQPAGPAFGGGYSQSRAGMAGWDYKAKAKEDSVKLSELSKFAGGKTFYARDGRWMDSEAQKHEKAARVRVKFGSPDYFELIRKTPDALTWASLGRNVQFVWEGKLYEVYDD